MEKENCSTEININRIVEKEEDLKTPLEVAIKITNIAIDGFKLTFDEHVKNGFEFEDDLLESINTTFLNITELSHWTLSSASIDINEIKDNNSIENKTAQEMLVKIMKLANTGITNAKDSKANILQEVQELFSKINKLCHYYFDKYILLSESDKLNLFL